MDLKEKDIIEPTSSAFDYLLESLKEISPWGNIKIVPTNIGKDLIAGVVIAVISLPAAIAFGVGSGLGAIAGIWSAIIGGIFGGVFGGSKIGISGPTGPTMIQLSAIMVGYKLVDGSPDLNVAFTILFFSGVILMILSVLRVSRLIYFTPYSVVAGFMCGIGVIVTLLQINPFFGIASAGSIRNAVIAIPHVIENYNLDALKIALPCLAILLLWPLVQKRIKLFEKIPPSLLALIAGLAIEEIWHLQVAVVGHIPTGVPQLHIPEFGQFFEFFWPALSIAGLVIVDSLLTCIVADNITGEKHNSNRETFGQGLANLFSSLLGGLPTATSTVGTVTNYQSGGRTPLAAIVQSLILLALVLGLGPLVEHIPMACLAAILFKVGLNILDYKILSIFHRLPLTDMLVFSVVLVVTLVEDLLVAMAVGLIFAFFRFIQEISHTYKHNAHLLTELKHHKSIAIADNKIKVLKPNGPLFFGSVEPLNEVYREAKAHDVLIIDLDMVSFIDLSGAYAIKDLASWAEKQGRRVVISGGQPKIVNILERVNVIDEKRKREYFAKIEDAISYSQVAKIMNIIDHEVETTMILRSS